MTGISAAVARVAWDHQVGSSTLPFPTVMWRNWLARSSNKAKVDGSIPSITTKA